MVRGKKRALEAKTEKQTGERGWLRRGGEPGGKKRPVVAMREPHFQSAREGRGKREEKALQGSARGGGLPKKNRKNPDGCTSVQLAFDNIYSTRGRNREIEKGPGKKGGGKKGEGDQVWGGDGETTKELRALLSAHKSNVNRLSKSGGLSKGKKTMNGARISGTKDQQLHHSPGSETLRSTLHSLIRAQLIFPGGN